MLQLFSSKKKKFMQLQVDINAPEYDQEGKLIHNEEELDDEEERLNKEKDIEARNHQKELEKQKAEQKMQA